ncbi:hypothetical protein VP01_269g12 [Puccinia sorghi]|uniref:Uncharacterized protein n=1 Tax=Puccinia sorghi TaxID=27349 RepID=A0A0L6V4F9_9BASI|nr:hypothetical protein VP01_269g12 [Puccinia sorghi]
MALSVFSVILILSCTHFLLSGRHLVRGKVFTCEQSLAPVIDHPAPSTPSPLARETLLAPRQITSSTSLSITGIMPSNFATAPSITGITLSTAAPAPTITAIELNNIPVGPWAPLQPSESGGPLPTKELACKSEVDERTFTFCVANSCTGTARAPPKYRPSPFYLLVCQDINGVHFLCAGKCATRTCKYFPLPLIHLTTRYYSNVKLRRFSRLFTQACSNCQYDNVTKSKAFKPPWGREPILSSTAQQALSPTWMLSTLVASNIACLF